MPEIQVKNIDKNQVEQANRELNVLYEVSCAMRTTLELNHILYIILTGVTSHTGLGYNRAILFLVNPLKRVLECKMAIGPESGEHANKVWEYIENCNQDINDLIQADKVYKTINQASLFKSVKDLKFPLEPNSPFLLSQAYYRGQPWHLPPYALSGFQEDPFLKIFHTNDLLIMPLKAKDEVNGLIIADNIYTQKPINQDDVKIFTMLANQAGLAIENSHLYEMVVQQSLTDPITGLWNHRFFQEKLAEELQKAAEVKIHLSLIMIDIDDFKKLNDTYGHQHGDLLLKSLAQILTNSSRDIDFVCRYGGEEFAVILCGANLDQGWDIAERLRKRIEEFKFPSPDGQNSIPLTISVGLANFPDDAANKEELIAMADKAMYIAKFSGKNKTCFANHYKEG